MKTYSDTEPVTLLDATHAQLRQALRQATEDKQVAQAARLLSQPERLSQVQRDLTIARDTLAEAAERYATTNRHLHAYVRSKRLSYGHSKSR